MRTAGPIYRGSSRAERPSGFPLAVALANDPGLLLADEMVAQLDATTASTVVRDVFDADMAVLFVTHDTALADRADLRLRLRDRHVLTR